MGFNICYHYFIGRDGTEVLTRDLSERAPCTADNKTNFQAIHIALAGNFEVQEPTEAQMKALKSRIQKLKRVYGFSHILPHSGASPTKCPGKNLNARLDELLYGVKPVEELYYDVSRYYSPVQGQERYYRDTYEQDAVVNCNTYYVLRMEQGDGSVKEVRAYRGTKLWREYGHLTVKRYGCMNTADGTDLRKAAPYSIVACPPEIELGTRLHIEGVGNVRCTDRGGAIKGNRLDLWTGVGMDGLNRILNTKGGRRRVTILP